MKTLGRITLPAWLLVLAGAYLARLSAGSPASPPTKPNEPIAVPVRDGVAAIDLPTISGGDQSLVIISSLARDSGPFWVDIACKSVADAEPLAAAPFQTPSASTAGFASSGRGPRRRAETAPVASGSLPAPAPERAFWLMVRGDDFSHMRNYEIVRARLASAGEHCAVYRDVQCADSPVANGVVQEIIHTFDDEVYPVAARTLGRHHDVDGDGRFTILLTPWLGRLASGAVSVGGFVRGSDFYASVDAPLSNRCDMMYLNDSLPAGPHLRTLIAHEYTHAVTLSEHVFPQGHAARPGCEEESWLDEAIAHVAENLHGYSWTNLDYRVSAFFNSPESYRLVVDDYYAADLWRSHGNRGSTYLFLRWCVDRYGEAILGDLVQSDLCGAANIERCTGQPFEELYRAWSVSMFLDRTSLADRPDEFRSVDLRGPLGERVLAGPRYDWLSLADGATRISLAGTSTKYLIAHSPVDKASQIRIVAVPEAKLQVTVYRLPQTTARLSMHVANRPASEATGGAAAFDVTLIEHTGSLVNLEHISWECSATGSNRQSSHGVSSRAFTPTDIERLAGSAVVSPGGPLVLPGFPVGAHATDGGRLTFKAVGRDAAGHRVSAWHTLELPSPTVAETARTVR
jgi:hypothetical protein